MTRGKLPYRLRWDARIVETRRPNGFTIEATGDFVGRGVWSFNEHGEDLEIVFDWRLRAEKPMLKVAFLSLETALPLESSLGHGSRRARSAARIRPKD